MGELLRSAYAKRLVNQHQVILRSKVLRMHQWRISVPGACEGLCHWRGTIEPLAANGTLEPPVAADLDLVNMYGKAEWPRIHPKLQRGPSGNIKPTPSLPSPREPPSPPNRGAEQSDVLGTIRSALVLGQAREAHLGTFLSNPIEDKGVCDEWFVDDEQVFARPFQFDPFLRALGAALATFGATRGCAAHVNVKSSARLLCPPERHHEFQGWDTPYVHDTVDVRAQEAGTTALGSAFGSREHINARAWESVRASDEMRCAVGSVDHAPTEMVLTRQCADVSKLMYHMRINGDMLDQDLLVAFAGQLRASVSAWRARPFSWDSLMKPRLSASYPGATSSPVVEEAMQDQPLSFFDTREASLRTMVTGTTSTPWSRKG